MISKYVVRVGKKLYIATNLYNYFPSTTTDIFKACMFDRIEDAEKLAKKALKSEVIEIVLSTQEELSEAVTEFTDEIEDLKAANRQFKKERDDALAELEEIKSRKKK